MQEIFQMQLEAKAWAKYYKKVSIEDAVDQYCI